MILFSVSVRKYGSGKAVSGMRARGVLVRPEDLSMTIKSEPVQ